MGALPASCFTFSTSSSIGNSLPRHSLSQHICPRCNKSYKRGYDLRRHIYVRYECGVEKQFKCSQCGRAFAQRVHLKLHCVRIHQVFMWSRFFEKSELKKWKNQSWSFVLLFFIRLLEPKSYLAYCFCCFSPEVFLLDCILSFITSYIPLNIVVTTIWSNKFVIQTKETLSLNYFTNFHTAWLLFSIPVILLVKVAPVCFNLSQNSRKKLCDSYL